MAVIEVESLDEALELQPNNPVTLLVMSVEEGDASKSAFFDMIMKYLPCDPPFNGRSWDAGMDSVSGGFANCETADIAVYWRGSRSVKSKNLPLYQDIVSSFRLMSRETADKSIMFDHVKRINFYFGP